MIQILNKGVMANFCRSLFFIIFLLLFNCKLFAAYSGNVLILNSYYPDYRWANDEFRGIVSVLDNHPSIRYYVEFMDSNRIRGDEYFRYLQDIYNLKYSSIKFDCIICADNDALNFLNKYHSSLFKGVPVVFCGINNYRPSDVTGFKDFTGVNEAISIKETLEIAFSFLPEAKRVFVINDAGDTGKRLKSRINDVSEKYFHGPSFDFADGDLEKIFSEVQSSSKDKVVLYTVFFKDTKGKNYGHASLLDMLRGVSHVPIFGLWDFHLDRGIIGGKLISGFYQGETAAKLALRVLSGEKASSIPVIMESPNKFFFDYREIERFAIDESLLPKDAILINKKQPLLDFYRMHKNAFIIIIAIFILTILFFLTLFVIRELQRRREIISSERLLREIINSMDEAVYLLTPEGILLECNEEGKRRVKIDSFERGKTNLMSFFPPEVTAQRLEYIKLACDTGLPVTLTDKRNGLILQNSIYPISNENGKVDRLCVVSYDITSLKQNEELLGTIISDAPIGLLYTTTHGKLLLSNSVAENLLNIKKDESTGLYCKAEEGSYSCFLDEDKFMSLLSEVNTTGHNIYNHECQVNSPDGYRHLLINAAPTRDINEVISGIIFMILDVTESVNLRKELEESKDKITMILESINDGFFVVNRDGIINFVNARALEIWGLKSEEIIGRPAMEVFLPKYFSAVYDQLEITLRENIFTKVEHYQKNTKRWYLLHLYPYKEGVSIYFTDITYRKELEEKLKEIAHKDSLTGLLNRRAAIYFLEKAISSSQRDKKALTLAFIDIDGLKKVNDTFGHNEGDRMIVDVCKIIHDVLRESDVLCRLGGDEFMAILPGCTMEQTVFIKRRIESGLDAANRIGDHPYRLDASIGFAEYPHDKKISAEEFVSLADEAMYKVKMAKKAARA